jgi:hypothetical protein
VAEAVVVAADGEDEEAGTATDIEFELLMSRGSNHRLTLDLNTLTDATGQVFF